MSTVRPSEDAAAPAHRGWCQTSGHEGEGSGWWPFIAGAVVVGAGLWLLFAGWGSEHVAGYRAYAVPLVALVLGWIAWVWRARASPAGPGAANPDLDHVAGLLAQAVKEQWERAAGERGW